MSVLDVSAAPTCNQQLIYTENTWITDLNHCPRQDLSTYLVRWSTAVWVQLRPCRHRQTSLPRCFHKYTEVKSHELPSPVGCLALGRLTYNTILECIRALPWMTVWTFYESTTWSCLMLKGKSMLMDIFQDEAFRISSEMLKCWRGRGKLMPRWASHSSFICHLCSSDERCPSR